MFRTAPAMRHLGVDEDVLRPVAKGQACHPDDLREDVVFATDWLIYKWGK